MRSARIAIIVFTPAVCAALVLAQAADPAGPVITVDRNTGAAATHAFKFDRIASPQTDDAGAKAKLVLVDGEMDSNAGSFSALNDGLLPRDEDEPGANFFFDAGTPGGRFEFKFDAAIDIAEVRSYSWHPNTRGPQVYTLYASDGANPKFAEAPRHGVDPMSVGWSRVAAVDTRPQGGDGGGQYAVRIANPAGSLGKFQYLLFDCAVTETSDDYGNTFYSEIDVIQKGGSAVTPFGADERRPPRAAVLLPASRPEAQSAPHGPRRLIR